MTVGTRSVLYGAHCAVLHLVPRGRLVQIVRLSLGRSLVGKLLAARHRLHFETQHGRKRGETHVELGARIMGLLFGESWLRLRPRTRAIGRSATAGNSHDSAWPISWLSYSRLLVVSADDKGDGELSEYMLRAKERQAGSEHFTDYESARLNSSDAREWLEGLKSYTQRWVDEHRNGGADNWTVGACAESTAAFR